MELIIAFAHDGDGLLVYLGVEIEEVLVDRVRKARSGGNPGGVLAGTITTFALRRLPLTGFRGVARGEPAVVDSISAFGGLAAGSWH